MVRDARTKSNQKSRINKNINPMKQCGTTDNNDDKKKQVLANLRSFLQSLLESAKPWQYAS